MKAKVSIRLSYFFLILGMFLVNQLSYAATYQILNLKDQGKGSLRDAILKSNENPDSTIIFSVNGKITLQSPLPSILKKVTINGSTAPNFQSEPVVCIDFAGFSGLILSDEAAGSVIKSLSLIHASDAAITLEASNVTIADNYIGLDLNGAVAPNKGDGILITAASRRNLIGRFNPVVSQDFYSQTLVPSGSNPNKLVTTWKGVRLLTSQENNYLIAGASAKNGLLYSGAIDGTTGSSYFANFPNSSSTIAWGPNDTGKKNAQGKEILQLVGSYAVQNGDPTDSLGFLWTGVVEDLPSNGMWETINYPNSIRQSTHSVSNKLAVGDSLQMGEMIGFNGPTIAYIYDISSKEFLATVNFPPSRSTSAYGIWHNGLDNYTICGSLSQRIDTRTENDSIPFRDSRAYIVDYNARTGKFSNWKTFDSPYDLEQATFVTHFTGISSAEPGVYTLSANIAPLDELGDPLFTDLRGALVTIRRQDDDSFGVPVWEELQNPGSTAKFSADSVYSTNLVGLSFSNQNSIPYQATVNLGFQLSNVISGNAGNGVKIVGSSKNILAMNYIGTDPTGSLGDEFGNGENGIFLTDYASHNLIGGQVAGDNNPTGDKGQIPPTFFRPPQGNLISGNQANGVYINKCSSHNILSGNFIGTDSTGTLAVGNRLNGVKIKEAHNNSLIGCLVKQNPFVFYNVISGNGQEGIIIKNANNIFVQGNFVGVNSTNDEVIPNKGNGILVRGNSKNTNVGGIIPLGNVVSGNALNGIAVIDEVSDFISFNTFGGLFAFRLPPAANGRNGLLITSVGKNNSARTNLFGGNKWNGIEISGNASGVQILDTGCGLNSNLQSAIPNERNGILIGGTSHDNFIGGFAPSVEVTNHFGGNKGYGICITDHAYNNRIFGSVIGVAFNRFALGQPNQKGGILLDSCSSSTTIGGKLPAFANQIGSNSGAGISIVGSQKNKIIGNSIKNNTQFGICAKRNCCQTVIKNNMISNNGNKPRDNVKLTDSTGIRYVP